MYLGGKDISLKQINSCLIKDFERKMKSEGKSLNTISFYMRNLRAIYNKAILEKRIDPKRENPFSSVFTGFKKTKKRALSLSELQLLDKIDFSSLIQPRGVSTHSSAILSVAEHKEYTGLYFAWRLFFFCFHARGMSFVDMCYLRKENIRGGVICYYRKKTGQAIEIKITPILQALIEGFSEDVKYSPYVFPIIKDSAKSPRQQYESALRLQNLRLKKLGKLAGLKHAVSTHVSRHSWATIAKEENLPIWVISEGLGHSSEKMTYTYLASFDRSVLDQANDVIYNAVTRQADRLFV